MEKNKETKGSDASTAHCLASAAKTDAAVTDLNCLVNAIGGLGLDWDEIASQALDPDFFKAQARGLHWTSLQISRHWKLFQHRQRLKRTGKAFHTLRRQTESL